MTIGLDQAFASCFLTLVRICDWKLAITSCKCFPSNIDVTKQIAKSRSIKPLWLQWRQESGEYRQWRILNAKMAVEEIFLLFFCLNFCSFKEHFRLWTVSNLFWYLYGLRGQSYLTLHKKWSFPLRISSVIVIKFPADMVTFTEETLNGKLHFLWSVKSEPAISLLVFEMLVKN